LAERRDAGKNAARCYNGQPAAMTYGSSYGDGSEIT
jgi:hypothetical protein